MPPAPMEGPLSAPDPFPPAPTDEPPPQETATPPTEDLGAYLAKEALGDQPSSPAPLREEISPGSEPTFPAPISSGLDSPVSEPAFQASQDSSAEPDDRLKRAEELARRLEASENEKEGKKKKGGFLSRLFGRKKSEPEPFDELPMPTGAQPDISQPTASAEPEAGSAAPSPAADGSLAVPVSPPAVAFAPQAPETSLAPPAPFAGGEEPLAPSTPATEPEDTFESVPSPPEVPDEAEPVETSAMGEESKLSAIEVSLSGSKDVGPAVIQRQIQVPITLGREDMLRGATLKLTLEIQVEASDSESGASDDSRVA